MKNDEIFQKAKYLTFADLEAVAAKYIRQVLFKVLFSSGGVSPIGGPSLKSGKKYDIFLSDDLEGNLNEQTEVFVHELLHIWLCDECGIKHRDEYEEEIIASAGKLAREYRAQLQTLLGQYLVK